MLLASSPIIGSKKFLDREAKGSMTLLGNIGEKIFKPTKSAMKAKVIVLFIIVGLSSLDKFFCC